jgi:long-chain fatty acid transport protein
MHCNAVLRATAVAALVVSVPAAFATNGYFSHGYGTKAKGMGGAGVAWAQDGFAGANNPAQSAFAGTRYDAGVDLFMPVRGAERSMTGMGVIGSADSAREKFLIPEFGYNRRISDQVGVGLTVYGNGGMNTTYRTNLLNGAGDMGVDLMQLVVAPTWAYKVSADHALGVSPLLVYQKFKSYGLQAFDQTGMQQMSSLPGRVTNNGYDGSTGVGFRFGYLGQLNQAVSVGASYSPKINMGRFDKYAGLFAGAGDFDIPENYTLGLAVQASPAVLVALDYQHIGYGGVAAIGNPSFNQAPLGTPGGPGFGWSNVSVWKLGAQWAVDENLTLRAGYNKGDNPINNMNVSFNILAPGVVTDHLTFGATRRLDQDSEVSFSYMYAKSTRVTGVSMFDAAAFGGPGNGSITETIRMKQSALGVQYSRKF